MSAIAGIFNFDGMPVTAEAIGSMTHAMARRGPDGLSQWVGDSVALGQCMFHTTPESLEETQPWPNEDGSLVLVMDGRVDNVDDLRTKLLARGARLRNRCDAELVLRAYEAWREDCPDHIIGEFVFVIWDGKRRQLFGARDALGSRHFYYHAGASWFGFSSEIKGLLALGRIEKRLDEACLLNCLVPRFSGDDQEETFYQDIKRIPAGHAIRVTAREVEVWRYWDPGTLPERKFASMDECAEAFLEQFRIAVKSRLRSIGPVAAALSGGLDSSSIVALVSKEFRGDLSHPLKTFSLVLDEKERCHEWPHVRRMQEDDWIESTVITSDRAPEFCDAYLDVIFNSDQPFASHGFMAVIVDEMAKAAGCKVYLDGGAGDLLFYSEAATADVIFQRGLYRHIPSLLAAMQRHGGVGRLQGLGWLAGTWLKIHVPKWARLAYRDMQSPDKVYGKDLARLRPEVARRLAAQKREDGFLDRVRFEGRNDQRNHARRFTAGSLTFPYERKGESALSNGMEPRSPYSDRRMIEFAVAMPAEAKFYGPWYKYFLRQTMAGVLPDEVRWRSRAGGHPGWKFWDTAMGPLLQGLGMTKDPSGLTRLDKWVDVPRLTKDWSISKLGSSREDVSWLFVASVLDRWLARHNL